MIVIIPAPIRDGDNTHHHDQSILPNSLRVIKTIVSRPKKPTPPEDEEFLLMTLNKLLHPL